MRTGGWSTLSLAMAAWAGLAVHARPASAIIYPCLDYWAPGTEVQVYVNVQSFSDLGYSATAVEHLVRAAIDEWSTAGRSNIRMKYAGRYDYPTQNASGCDPDWHVYDVVVQMNPGTWEGRCSTQGTTECAAMGWPAPCCTIIWNGENCARNWTEGWPDPATTTYGLWDVITHELGHTLCAGHTGVSDSKIVMYPTGRTDTSHRFLKPNDIWQLQNGLGYGDRTNYSASHRYSADGAATWDSYGGFSFPGDPQDGVALDVGWDANSGYFYVAAWSDVDDGDRIRVSYGDGVNWDPPIDLYPTRSVQVPAVAIGKDGSTWYTVVSYLGGNSDADPYTCEGNSFCGGTGRNMFVQVSDDFGDTWSSPPIFIEESVSGPALAHYGGDCFILAYVPDDAAAPDQIRTKVSCDGGYTWGSTHTNAERSTDRPAIAWGDDVIWGGIVWTTNVTAAGNVTANYMRTGRLQNAWGVIDISPSPDTERLYTSNFPSLTVSDAQAAQPNRYVRVYRRYLEVAGGRDLRAQYDDDLSTNNWAGAVILQSSRSPASAAYSDWYNEFWSLYVR